MEIKENEKRDKNLALARELKKPLNTRMIVISVVIGMPEMIPKLLEKELGELEIAGQAETIQTLALLRLARILKRVRDT